MTFERAEQSGSCVYETSPYDSCRQEYKNRSSRKTDSLLGNRSSFPKRESVFRGDLFLYSCLYSREQFPSNVVGEVLSTMRLSKNTMIRAVRAIIGKMQAV